MNKLNRNELISIIIPIYKVEEYIHKCLDSVLSQTYKNIEIILVDDGSPDECPKICEEYQKKDSRIKVIHKQNGGLFAARISGIQVSTGVYLSFVDSDDWIEPDFIEKLYETAIEYEADIVNCDFFRNMGRKVSRQYEKPGMSREETVYRLFDGRFSAYVWLKLIKRNLFDIEDFEDIGRLSMWEDVVFSSVFYFYCKKIGYIQRPLYHYRFNPLSICFVFSENNIKDYIKAINFVESFYKKKGLFNKFEDSFLKLKARAKCNILHMSNKENRKKYLNLFSECDSVILKTTTIPLYIRIESILFLRHFTILGTILHKTLFIARQIKIKIHK